MYPLFLPGEKARVRLVKNSVQQYQAIGYFDDKTIIVAEDRKNFISKNVILTITSAMFTSAGKIIFANKIFSVFCNNYRFIVKISNGLILL
ncbi:MAG: hypothetical protein LE168_03675, partial [Endomicrobium sp.]|nr:hypothetical protein [Endomicrobium sp.]